MSQRRTSDFSTSTTRCTHRHFYFSLLLLLLHYSGCTAQLVRGRPPSFRDDDYPARVLLVEGQPLILNCRADRAESVHWLKNGFPIALVATILQIAPTTRNDSGLYRCVATNSVASALSPPVKVTVQCEFVLRTCF